MRISRAISALTLAAGFLVSAITAAPAQTYPSRPITLVVPFAAGGTTDAIARVARRNPVAEPGPADRHRERRRRRRHDRRGARRARAAPDGYTLLLHQPGLAAAADALSEAAYDAEKDFAGVGLINTSASIISGRANVPAQQL